jgi:hypothetical protein
MMVSKPDPHKRLTVNAGALWGMPHIKPTASGSSMAHNFRIFKKGFKATAHQMRGSFLSAITYHGEPDKPHPRKTG